MSSAVKTPDRVRRNQLKAWLYALVGSYRCPVCSGATRPGGASWMHSYLRCEGCDLLFVAELPTSENLEQAYLRVHLSDYQVEHKRDWGPWKAHKGTTLDALGVHTPDHRADQPPLALDIGCGEGAMLEVLARRGWQPWGLELNPAMAQQGREKGLSVAVGSVEAPRSEGLPRAFDLILMNHLVEHLRNPVAAVCTAAGWLTPAGRLVLETPLTPDHDNIDHLYCFGAASLEILLSGAGLTPQRWYDYVDDNYKHHNLACVAERRTLTAASSRARPASPPPL